MDTSPGVACQKSVRPTRECAASRAWMVGERGRDSSWGVNRGNEPRKRTEEMKIGEERRRMKSGQTRGRRQRATVVSWDSRTCGTFCGSQPHTSKTHGAPWHIHGKYANHTDKTTRSLKSLFSHNLGLRCGLWSVVCGLCITAWVVLESYTSQSTHACGLDPHSGCGLVGR